MFKISPSFFRIIGFTKKQKYVSFKPMSVQVISPTLMSTQYINIKFKEYEEV